MNVSLVRIWASPSTLHLRVMITAKNQAWSLFKDVHVPKDSIAPEDLKSLLLTGEVDELEPQVQPGFW